MTIIVLEGPDLAGKTTIVRNLMSRLINAEMLRQGPPPSGVDILEHYLRPIQDWCYEPMLVRPRWLILDRWHVGELIYGPLLRGQSQLTGQQADYIDMVLNTFGCNFTYVSQPLPVLEQRWDLRGDGLIKREWLDAIRDGYELWMNRRFHWATYTDAQFGYAGFVPSPMAGPYIGPRDPKVLLLGDRRNDPRFVFPFVPARATSGHWLMGAMHEAKVNHMEVGLLNACEHDAILLHDQWWNLGQPPVITLGRNAERQWKRARVYSPQSEWDEKTHYLNHPQYERRFHYLKMERYGQAIKRVMEDG
jgi:hypothetical protein